MVKTLMKQIKEYKKDSLLTMLFAALEVVLEIIIPLLMASHLLIKELKHEICLMLQNMEHSCLSLP